MRKSIKKMTYANNDDSQTYLLKFKFVMYFNFVKTRFF